MGWDHHSIGIAALARGLIDPGELGEALRELRRAGSGVSPEDFWLAGGRLTRAELDGILALLPAGSSHFRPRDTYQERAAPAAATPASAGAEDDGVPLAIDELELTVPFAADGDQRYAVVGQLGGGGMGDVVECTDTRLSRRVALKTLKHGLENDESAVRMLDREARVTGNLEHPNIIPVYDAGSRPASGPYYVMRLVKQPSLEEVLQKLSRAVPEAVAEYTLGRLLRYFVQVCQAVDYAHSRGVVHCDIKPPNILLGDFGEVLVVDWGLAFDTKEGVAFRGGTPGYMAPEQHDHKRANFDARTDVFALGSVLYEILCIRRAFPAAGAVNKPPMPPRMRAPERNVPAELEDICLRALSVDPADRFQTAKAMSNAIEEFLEGTKEKERRLERAEEQTGLGEMMATGYVEIIDSRPDRLAEMAELRAGLNPWDPPESKQALWDAEDRLAVTDVLAVRTLQAALSNFDQALEAVPGFARARAGLAKLYWLELQRARDRKDELNRIHYEELLRQYDDGTYAEPLRNEATLRVGVPGGVPQGAIIEVALRALEERGRRLVETRESMLGPAPVASVRVADGRYTVILRRLGLRDVKYPVLVRAGSNLEIEVPLEDPADVIDGEIFVPGGPARLGGAVGNMDARPVREVVVPSFFIGERPVTFREYLGFCAEVLDPAVASTRLPRAGDGAPFWELEGGRWRPARILTWNETDPERLFNLPVFGVDAESAEAFAVWKAARTGRPYRLPTEDEWEKAARGTDGRPFPWGEHFDASFCKIRESRAGLPAPEPSGAFPADVSPYGVIDLAGGIADWTLPVEERAPETAARQLVSRGGAWCDWSIDCHLGSRRLCLATERSARLGFRLVRDPAV